MIYHQSIAPDLSGMSSPWFDQDKPPISPWLHSPQDDEEDPSPHDPCTGCSSRLASPLKRRQNALPGRAARRMRAWRSVGQEQREMVEVGHWDSKAYGQSVCPLVRSAHDDRGGHGTYQWQKSLLMTKKVSSSDQYRVNTLSSSAKVL